MKRIVLLGSSGSIGENTLRVVRRLSAELRIVGLAVNRNYKRVLKQARSLGVRHVAVADVEKAELCRLAAPADVKVHSGLAGVEELASMKEADIVLCAVVGMSGLRPVLAALRNGTDVALATKEVLVAAGGIVTAAARRHGARILPVDSEHSAVFQCISAQPSSALNHHPFVRRIILTASGGPFAARRNIDFKRVTVAEALNHPRWDMGRKVTVDSATLMNKGLEIMEAHWLFGVPVEKIDVVIHPESIVHSLVEFVDGSVLAQLSPPDMRFAIQYALTHPARRDGALPRLDLPTIKSLHFNEPDTGRFPCLRLAREAARIGGTMPAVLNAANEEAVQKFLEGRIAFSGIWRTVENVMAKHATIMEPDLCEVLESDSWARSMAREWKGANARRYRN